MDARRMEGCAVVRQRSSTGTLLVWGIGIVVCLLLNTACGGGSGSASSDMPGKPTTPPDNGEQLRTLTEEEAAARAEEHIQRAVSALPVKPTLRLQDDSSTECLDPDDNGPRGRYEVGKTYWLDGLSPDRKTEIVNALYQHWVSNGYRVLTDERSKSEMFVSVEHNSDAFRMSVLESFEGDLSIGASSPCVWPDGVPPTSSGGQPN